MCGLVPVGIDIAASPCGGSVGSGCGYTGFLVVSVWVMVAQVCLIKFFGEDCFGGVLFKSVSTHFGQRVFYQDQDQGEK